MAYDVIRADDGAVVIERVVKTDVAFALAGVTRTPGGANKLNIALFALAFRSPGS